MTDQTRAAAALLYRTTINTLRRCRGSSTFNRSAKDLAHCATPQLVDAVRSNATLMHALALNYAMRVVVDLPPLPAQPDPAPTKAEVEIDLFAHTKK